MIRGLNSMSVCVESDVSNGLPMFELVGFVSSEVKDSLVVIGWEYEGVAWTAPESSKIPVYRVYNPNSGEHHYTKDAAEKDILVALGWDDEGICWYSDEKQGTPLYRLYNSNATGQYAAGTHHYTKDVEERDYLIAAVGMTKE